MGKKRRIVALLLVLVVVLTQIYLPGANLQVSADTPGAETMQENISPSTERGEKSTTVTEKKEVNTSVEEKTEPDAEKNAASEKAEDDQKDETEESEEKMVSDQTKTPAEDNTQQNENEIEGSDTKRDEPAVISADPGAVAGDDTVAYSGEGTGESIEPEPEAGEGIGGGTESGAGEGIKGASEDDSNLSYDQYHVTFRVTGKDGQSVQNAEITLSQSTDKTNYKPTAADSDGSYKLNVKKDGKYISYKFSITASAYTTYEGEFCFDPESVNSYFKVNEVGQSFDIDVKLTANPTEDDSEPPFKNYNVKFHVTGEDDKPVENAEITLSQSIDGTGFTPMAANPDSDGYYSLNVKQDGEFINYKFGITASCYLKTEGEFCFDPTSDNPYFDIKTVGQSFVIDVKLTVDPNKYRLEIKALDENGNPIEDAKVSMDWSVDIYGYYDQPNSGTEGVYLLDEKRSNGDTLFYRFKILSDGYVPYQSSKFVFYYHPNWIWRNEYFDVTAQKHFLTITVKMTSVATELDNAKKKALQELENYKRLEDYRQAEQDKITSWIEMYSDRINKATAVSSVTFNLNQAKNRMDGLKTKIAYEDEEYRARIYFQTDDGQKIPVDRSGIVTITNLDSGNFYITHPDGSLYTNNEWDAKWRCVYEYEDQDHPGNIAYQVVVGTYGQYGGVFPGTYDATVTLGDLGRAISFKVKVVKRNIDKLRAIIDGKDVSGGTINVMGSEEKIAVIEGRLEGTDDRWISVPARSIKYTAGGSTSILPATRVFRTWGNSGSVTYTLDVNRSVSVTVNIKATIVKPTGVKVICPSTATVGDWNGAYNQYVGIMEGTGAGYYRVVVTPSNASNPGVTWEDLTPDVATFQSKHALGIVPKKAGTAKFRVTCNADPKVSTTVTILFKYEKPLKTAQAEKSVYYAKTSDKTIDLKIITNGQSDSTKGASEQRFHWSYSTSGVVKVADAVHYDKSSVTIPSWFSHTISILGTGTVYVTGTPYDTTENCKPVTFRVVVTDTEDLDKAEAERVEKLILAIGKVTLEKKSQIQHARSEFRALTSTQKGLVDDDIYNILVQAELELRRLERGQAGGNNGDGGEEDNGGNPPAQEGSGDLPQDGENTDDSGDTGQEGSEATEGEDTEGADAEGTDAEETETADDALGSEEKTESTENKKENAENKKQTTVTAADNAEQKTDAEKPEADKESGSLNTGRKFFEVDIRGIQKGIEQFVEEIDPVTKAVVVIGALVAFVFGFFWRRRQYLKDKKNNKR